MASKSYLLLLVSLVTPLLTLSCSDEPPDPLDSADGFCAEWSKNACSEAVLKDCQSTEAKCEDQQKENCLDLVSEVKYTRTGAEECLDFIRDAYRDNALELDELNAFSSLGEPCDLLLAGVGDVGDECDDTADCDTTEGLKCVIKFGDTRGQCHEPETVLGGNKCSDAASVCTDGFYCDGKNCLAKSTVGDECSETSPCDEGSRCVIDGDAETGECEPKLVTGDDCETKEQCASGICDRNEDETVGLCVDFLELGRRVDMCEEFR